MQLEYLAYDVEDFLEHFNYAIKLPQKKKTLKFSLKSFSQLGFTKPYSMLESITSRLDEIMEQKELLGLIVTDVYPNRHVEGSIMPEADVDVYGRDEEKRDIIAFLEKSEQGVAVYPIVGMAGIGKTSLASLARYAYNYNFSKEFDVKAWISVSKGYDRRRIFENIVTYVEKSCSMKDPNALHEKVEEVLASKKFLIVLDDVWEIGIREWDTLKAPFLKGGVGSKIIVTTQNHRVADTVSTVKDYATLSLLSEEDCWKIFKRCACVGENDKWKHDIGRSIVKNCYGLPLAVRLVGSLLRWKDDMEEWKNILENEPGDVLKMSFDNLSYDSKNCFLCCSMYPEDWEFKEEDVVPIWLALGLVSCEEDGHKCFHELLSRSMLMESGRGGNCIHDLLRDMGNEMSGDKFCSCEKEIGSIDKIWHLYLNAHISLFDEMVKKVSEMEKKVLPLRMFAIREDIWNDALKERDMGVIFGKLRNARVVSLPGCNLSKLQ